MFIVSNYVMVWSLTVHAACDMHTEIETMIVSIPVFFMSGNAPVNCIIAHDNIISQPSLLVLKCIHAMIYDLFVLAVRYTASGRSMHRSLSVKTVLILDSRYWGGGTYIGEGVKFDAFFNVFVFWVFFWGGDLGFGGGGGIPPPPEIAGNNTGWKILLTLHRS